MNIFMLASGCNLLHLGREHGVRDLRMRGKVEG